MTTQWRGASQGLDAGQADWHTACELLKAGQYARASEILQQAQLACEERKDAVLSHLLAVACRICLACGQSRAELEWHRQAYEAADQREDELLQELQAILDLISGRETLDVDEKAETALSSSLIKIPSHERITPEAGESSGLWRRIQTLFSRGVSHQNPQDETPVVSVEASMPTSIVEIEAQTTSPDIVVQAPIPLSTADEQAETPPFVEQAKTPAALPFSHTQEAATVSLAEPKKRAEQVSPSLVVYCLGPFRVYQDEQPVTDWPSSKGKAIFKYLVAHRPRPVDKEVLMELFWPGAHPDAARNNLNVAIYGLRQALRKDLPFFSHVLYQDDCYQLNSELNIWLDYEAFTSHFSTAQALERRGDLASAIREYRAAEVLYEGEFLEEDRYEDWPIPQRQRLREDHLTLLDCLSRYYCSQDDDVCVSLCRKILAVDPCREEAHRRLMRCYSRQGQAYLALRQYHYCVEALKEELEIIPTLATTELYERIRRHQQV